jgi:cytochrome P450
MAYAEYFFLRYPQTFQALCEEVRREFTCVEEMTSARLSSLNYLNAGIQEGNVVRDALIVALRMRPPVPTGLQRVAPNGGASINGQYIPERVHP